MSVFEALKPEIKNPESVMLQLEMALGISPVTARLLINRGITTCEEAHRFMNPDLSQLYDPFDLTGIKEAADRIRAAILDKEKITIYGDYDVDGLTSTALLYLYLKNEGAEVDIYIPGRLEEGYGLNNDAVRSIVEGGTGLIITVDCGISAVEEIDLANNLGADVILTDHHNPASVIPNAYAVINPKLCKSYPFKELAGVGVAAKLVHALGGIEAVEDYLDLICIGTIADIVPLIDENRIFAYEGIKKINESPSPGVRALIETLDIKNEVNSSNISYGIAPVLNAPGRLSTFDKGFELLICQNAKDAVPAALSLVRENEKRREIENRMLDLVRNQIDKQVDLAKDRIIIVSGKDWHSGVVGIVASRIAEIYNRPAVIISLEDDIGTGSARSIRGFNLYNALSICKEYFIRFGGHEYAAGLSIERDKIDIFREKMLAYAERHITDDMLIPRHFHDGVLRSDDITPSLHDEINRLAPFGSGNPSPKFLLDTAMIGNSYIVGKNSSHLKLDLHMGPRSWDAIGFGMADAASELYRGCPVSILASLSINNWMGISKTQFQIYGIKKVYNDIKEIDNLLSLYYFKFFNVFLSQFMYNNSVVETGRMSIPQYKPAAVEEICSIAENTLVGTAVLVYDVNTAKSLLEELAKRKLLDSIAVAYNKPNPVDGIGNNVIILAPDAAKIPFDHYHTVLVPGSYDSFDISPFQLERKSLEIIYRWIRKLIPGRNIWQSETGMLLSCNNDTGVKFSGFQLMLALEIFKELNFISIVNDYRAYKLYPVKNPVSKRLDESRLFIYYKRWINELPDRFLDVV